LQVVGRPQVFKVGKQARQIERGETIASFQLSGKCPDVREAAPDLSCIPRDRGV